MVDRLGSGCASKRGSGVEFSAHRDLGHQAPRDMVQCVACETREAAKGWSVGVAQAHRITLGAKLSVLMLQVNSGGDGQLGTKASLFSFRGACQQRKVSLSVQPLALITWLLSKASP